MLTIKIIQNTFLKQSTAFSETLPANQKVSIQAGRELKIKSYFKKERHYCVTLAEAIEPIGNIGFFFEDHIQIEEIRGVWITNIDSDFLTSPETIKEGITKLKQLGFNTIYPVVWNRGFTLYPSEVAEQVIGLPVAEEFKKDRDILAEIIAEAKDNFRIIPWFEYGLMTPPYSSLATNKPEWITLTKKGDKTVDDQWWLNPCHPEVCQFMTDLIVEVVKNYDIDGVQLDDHFGLPSSLGFDEFTLKRFKEEIGNVNPLLNPNTSLWKIWRMNQVTELLRQVFKEVKMTKGDCIISISPNPLGFSKTKYLADWKAWEREGISEELVIQLYGRSIDDLKAELKKEEIKDAHQHIPTVIGLLTGLKPNNKRVSKKIINNEVQTVRDMNFAGFSFFFFGSLFDLRPNNETIESRETILTAILATDKFV